MHGIGTRVWTTARAVNFQEMHYFVTSYKKKEKPDCFASALEMAIP